MTCLILLFRLICSEHVIMQDFGAVVSEPGSELQHWHVDDEIFESLFDTHGLAGHDLPPFSIGVMIPLLNTTIRHGPTEFCMGRNAVNRIHKFPQFRNQTLRQVYLDALAYWNREDCPPRFLRTPLPQFGDMLLFFFNTMHRGGENFSPDVRTVLYQTYVQPWFRDDNFNHETIKEFGSDPYLEDLFAHVRAAVPDHYRMDEESEEPEDASLEYQFDDLERMGTFEPPGGHAAEDNTSNSTHKRHEIMVSNVNVELQHLKLCFVSPIQNSSSIHPTNKTESDDKEDCLEAPPLGHGRLVNAYAGEVMQVVQHHPEHVILKSWTIQGSEQLFLAYMYFDQ